MLLLSAEKSFLNRSKTVITMFLFAVSLMIYAVYGWLDAKIETELDKIEARFNYFTIFEEWWRGKKK